jgi:hypothetical protein
MSASPPSADAAAPGDTGTAAPRTGRLRVRIATRGSRDWVRSVGAISRGELIVVGGGLLVLAIALLGSHVIHGNFYYDDWALTAQRKYQGYWATVNFYLHIDHRPLLALYLPLVSAVFGDNAHLQLGWLLLAHAGMCLCIYVFLRTAELERFSGAMVALLALVFPFADASWLYVIGSAGTMAVSLYLLGATAALHGLRASGRRAAALHGLAVVLYVMSVLTYELALVAIIFSVLLYVGRAPGRGVARRWAVDIGAMALTLLVTTRTVPLLPGVDVHGTLPLDQQFSHAKLIARQARGIVAASLEPFGVTHYDVILTVGALIALAGLLMALRLPTGDPVRGHLRRWLSIAALALGGTVAAWLVFVPADPYYSPGAPGVGNRINLFAGVCLCVGVYALATVAATLLLGRLRRARAWVPLGALLLSVAVAVGYTHRVDVDKSHWAAAAKLQRHDLAQLRRVLPRPAPNTRVLLFDTPANSAPGVPIFAAPWDLDGAIKLLYNDGTLDGYPVIAGITQVNCTASGVAPVGTGYAAAETGPYGLVTFVDGRTGSVLPIRNRQRCQRALRKLPPGSPLSSSGLL